MINNEVNKAVRMRCYQALHHLTDLGDSIEIWQMRNSVWLETMFVWGLLKEELKREERLNG